MVIRGLVEYPRKRFWGYKLEGICADEGSRVTNYSCFYCSTTESMFQEQKAVLVNWLVGAGFLIQCF